MATVHMMIGIQGSGKSTFASKLSREKNILVVSTDVVRMMHPDWEEPLIWPEVYKMCGLSLIENQDVIFDATNITPRVRKRFVDEVSKYTSDFLMKAYFFNTPASVCAKRVEERNKLPNELFLPIDVIFNYSKNIIKPSLDEGFSEIIIIDNEEN